MSWISLIDQFKEKQQGTTRYNLEKHVKSVHEKDWKFECPPCNKRFKHVYNLRAHNNNAHAEEQEKIYTVKSRAVDRSTIQFLSIFGVLLTETCY